MMNSKNNLVRLKVEFEHTPIMDVTKKIRNEEEFDEMVGDLRIKFFGK